MLSTSLFYLGFISIRWTSYKTRTNLIFLNFSFFFILSYFPQLCLYFLPEPHGVHLKLPCNFFLLKWAFLLKKLNSLLINCNKVMSNFLTQQFKHIYKRIKNYRFKVSQYLNLPIISNYCLSNYTPC